MTVPHETASVAPLGLLWWSLKAWRRQDLPHSKNYSEPFVRKWMRFGIFQEAPAR